MELGLSTYTFPWNIGIESAGSQNTMQLEELISYTAAQNICHLQIGDNYPLHLLSESRLLTAKQLAYENNVQLQVGTRGLKKQNILEYLEIASFLGSPFLRVVIDDHDFHPDEKEVVSIIRELLPFLQKNRVVLAIENHDRFTAAALRKIILETSEAYVAICLDTSNSLGAGEGIQEVLKTLLPYTVNLHIKDFNIKRVPHKMGFTVSGAIAGTGMLNIPKLLQQCSSQEKCRTATLEIWMDPDNNIEQTMSREKDWVTQSINYLKKYIQ